MKYMIKLTPLEPYFLGGERNYNYLGDGPKKYNYYIKSEKTPSQTTLLGVLRFEILQLNKLIKTDFNYSEDEKREVKKLIGEKSFNYNEDKELSFGQIISIGPLFLTDGENKYIKTPFNNVGDKEYKPFEMKTLKCGSSLGNNFLFATDYDAKKYNSYSYMNLKDGSLVSEYELFTAKVKTRIHKKIGKENTEAYFKKESYFLKKGISFAFYANIRCDKCNKYDEKQDIVYLGQDKSAFLIKFEKVENAEYSFEKEVENKLKKLIKSYENKDCDKFLYALSDIKIEKSIEYKNSAIIRTKTSKPIKTTMKNKLNGRYSLSATLHKLISAGSVFFGDELKEIVDKKYEKVGLNYVIEISGGGNES